jgi:pyruvate formate lyase activating enzyme
MAHQEAVGAGLGFVYLGNIATSDGENTRCPKCGSLVIRRIGFQAEIVALDQNGNCGKCGEPLNMVV